MRSNASAHIQINPDGLRWLGHVAKLDNNEQIAAAAGVHVSSVSRGINVACGMRVMSHLLHMAKTTTGVSEATAYGRLFRLVTDESPQRQPVSTP